MNIFNFLENTCTKYLLFYRKKRQYHYWTKYFKNCLKSLNRKTLTNSQKKEIRNVFGSNINYCCHEFYYSATGVFSPLYMSDPLYYAYIDPYFNDWERAKYIDHKCYYKRMFCGVQQPKLIAYSMNGFWYDQNDCLISVAEAAKLSAKFNTCFVKRATESEGGHGITFIDNSAITEKQLQEILSSKSYDVVIQEGLQQSETLSKINSSSVNTIRMLSLLKKDGNVKIYSTILRMGINGAKVDNASSGGITVGVYDNGQLKETAYSAKGIKFQKHPTSGIEFKDFIIPNFEKIKELVTQQAKLLPHFRLVSWDIALNEYDLPMLIEANLHFGEIDFHQLNNGPLFGDDTKEILKEVFS